ncbi:imidazole glycerol phosphate synthase subunit HisH, partial [Halomonas maura]|nr:imidazole glycerol phosphate synthase subunit HisH [Halomonas maura]
MRRKPSSRPSAGRCAWPSPRTRAWPARCRPPRAACETADRYEERPMTIAVIDYGMGNLHSVAKALEHVTHEHVVVTRDARRIHGATRLVLPGQGAIRDCMGELERTELRGLVQELL